MGLARGDVLPVEVPVEVDRGVDLLHDRIALGAEASAPHFVAHDASAEVCPSMTERSAPPRAALPRRRLISVVAAAVILAVLGGIYGIARLRSNPAATACTATVAAAGRLAPLARGEVAALAVAQTPF